MPISISSPSRNLFLLGSVGGEVITNFFRTVDKYDTAVNPNPQDYTYGPTEIRYNFTDQKFLLAGTKISGQSDKYEGWIEKRTGANAISGLDNQLDTEIGIAGNEDVELLCMELDNSNNILAAGKAGDVPFVARYSNAGGLQLQSTTNSGNVIYTGLAVDSNDNIYAAGSLLEYNGNTHAFIEKFDSNGNPGWGKSAYFLGNICGVRKIAANSRGEVVAVGTLDDDDHTRGYIVKLDTATGDVKWDKTLESSEEMPQTTGTRSINCEDVFIDINDQIYVVGRGRGFQSNIGFIIKMTAEGNIIWQKQTPVDHDIAFWNVKSDGETEQTIVLGDYREGGKQYGLLSKYAKNGDLVWRRVIYSSYNNGDYYGNRIPSRYGGGVNLDADPSFYYLLSSDEEWNTGNSTPKSFHFGKVSTSGNGLGDFEYDEGTGETIFYEIEPIEDEIGRLDDNSVRNDSSDFITYPFSPTKILFDDLATRVDNKKRHSDSLGFQYSGSPAIRPADFSELNLADEYDIGPNLLTTSSFRLSYELPGVPLNADGEWDTTGGWTAVDGSLSISQARMQVTRSGGVGLVCYKDIQTEVGETYLLHASFGNPTSNTSRIDVRAYDDSASDHTANMLLSVSGPSAADASGGFHRENRGGSFVATTSTTRIWFVMDNDNTSAYVYECYCCKYSWKDSSGKGNHGVSGGAIRHIDEGYWVFNGTNDIVTIGEIPGDFSEMTVELWWKTDRLRNWDNPIDCNFNVTDANGVTQSGNIGPRLEINASGTLTWVWGSSVDANDPKFSSIQTTITTGQWYHSVFTIDGPNLSDGRPYLNGELTGVNTSSSTGDWGQIGFIKNLILGRGFALSGDRYFDGQIGEVRIYPRALTAAQVFQNYNATKSKYIDEAPDTAPKISSDGIVIDSNLILNYDFANRATYDDTQYDRGDYNNWKNNRSYCLDETNTAYTNSGAYWRTPSIRDGKVLQASFRYPNPDATGNIINNGRGLLWSTDGTLLSSYREDQDTTPQPNGIQSFDFSGASDVHLTSNRIYVGSKNYELLDSSSTTVNIAGLIHSFDHSWGDHQFLVMTDAPGISEPVENASLGQYIASAGGKVFSILQNVPNQYSSNRFSGSILSWNEDGTGCQQIVPTVFDSLGIPTSPHFSRGRIFTSSDKLFVPVSQSFGYNATDYNGMFVCDLDGTNQVKVDAPQSDFDNNPATSVTLSETIYVYGGDPQDPTDASYRDRWVGTLMNWKVLDVSPDGSKVIASATYNKRPYGSPTGDFAMDRFIDAISDSTPYGTMWNSLDTGVADGGTVVGNVGYADLSDVSTRTYEQFATAYQYQVGNNIVGSESVMVDLISTPHRYYKVDFTSWSNGGAGAGFQYTRQEIDPSNGSLIGSPVTVTKAANDHTFVDVVNENISLQRGGWGVLFNPKYQGVGADRFASMGADQDVIFLYDFDGTSLTNRKTLYASDIEVIQPISEYNKGINIELVMDGVAFFGGDKIAIGNTSTAYTAPCVLVYDYDLNLVDKIFPSETTSGDNLYLGSYKIDQGNFRSHPNLAPNHIQSTEFGKHISGDEYGLVIKERESYLNGFMDGGANEVITSFITKPTTVKNLSSSSFPGTITGATFNSAGYFEFDGTNDYIQSSSVMAPGSADFSVIMWYKITGTGGRGGLFERAAASPFSGWSLGQGGSNSWACSVRDASNNNAQFNFTYPTVGEWTCDAFTWDVSAQTLTPYRNGANAGTATNSGTVGSLDGNTRYPMAIGGRLDSASPQYKPMECGEVQMYSKVLTAAEVLQNYNATRGKYGV